MHDNVAHSISLAPLVNLVAGYVMLALAALITVGGRKVLSLIHIKLTDAQWAVVRRTGIDAAQKLIAFSDASLMTKSVTVDDPVVAKFADAAISEIPTELKKLGIDPHSAAASAAVRSFIVAHIGEKQAQAASVQVPSQNVGG